MLAQQDATFLTSFVNSPSGYAPQNSIRPFLSFVGVEIHRGVRDVEAGSAGGYPGDGTYKKP